MALQLAVTWTQRSPGAAQRMDQQGRGRQPDREGSQSGSGIRDERPTGGDGEGSEARIVDQLGHWAAGAVVTGAADAFERGRYRHAGPGRAAGLLSSPPQRDRRQRKRQARGGVVGLADPPESDRFAIVTSSMLPHGPSSLEAAETAVTTSARTGSVHATVPIRSR